MQFTVFHTCINALKKGRGSRRGLGKRTRTKREMKQEGMKRSLRSGMTVKRISMQGMCLACAFPSGKKLV